VSRLFWLLVALCAAALALSAPFLLAAIRAAHPPLSPVALLAAQALQTLLLCALAAWAGVRFAPRAGLDAPWLRAFADRRDRPPAFGGVAIEAAALGSVTAIVVTAVALALRSSVPEALWRPVPAASGRARAAPCTAGSSRRR
jgi:hypothetical protein